MIQFETVDRGQLTAEEVKKLCKLYESSFGKPTWPGFATDIVSRPNFLCFFISVDGERVGFRAGYDVGCFAWRSWLLGVLPDHRRKGIGTELLVRGNAVLRERQYNRVVSNQAAEARALCVKAGVILYERRSGDLLYRL